MDELEGLYIQLLRRPADPTGLTAFIQQLQQGTSYEEVLAEIAGSVFLRSRLACALHPKAASS